MSLFRTLPLPIPRPTLIFLFVKEDAQQWPAQKP
jgi:hypothetical protein